MRWVPKWLGKSFADLFAAYGKSYFSAKEAQEILGKSLSTTRVILSKLSGERYLEKRRKGKIVAYRCADPYELVFRIGGHFPVPQSEYVPLARSLVTESLKFLGEDLVSIVLYGSIARGEAKKNSDMDVLMVVRNLSSGFLKRASFLYPVKKACRDTKLELWEKKGIYCTIQIYPLSTEEVDEFRPLFLDVTTDGKLLFDRKGFMEERLRKWRERLSEIGARKVNLPDGSWFWDLNLEKGGVAKI